MSLDKAFKSFYGNYNSKYNSSLFYVTLTDDRDRI